MFSQTTTLQFKAQTKRPASNFWSGKKAIFALDRIRAFLKHKIGFPGWFLDSLCMSPYLVEVGGWLLVVVLVA